MGWVKDNFLGGASKKAAEEQQKHMYLAQDILRDSVNEARGEIKPLFADAMTQSQSGYQDAINLLGGISGQKMGLAQQGNVNAQQALLAGAPQFQNAILGGPVDYSAFQPQQLDYDVGALQNALTPWSQQQLAQETPAVPDGSGTGSANQPGFTGISGGGGLGNPIIGTNGNFFMNGFNSGMPLSTLNNLYGDGSNILAGSGYTMRR